MRPLLLLLSAGLLAGCGPRPESAGAAASSAAVPAAPPSLPVLGPAPSWQVADLQGNPVRAADFKGKVVVLDFWATWCPPCRQEIPGYIAMMKAYAAEGLVVVGVSLDEAGVPVVKAFADKVGINYPVVMGTEEIQAAFGGLEGLPTTFLIDREGRVRDRKLGAEPAETYERKVLAVLREGK